MHVLYAHALCKDKANRIRLPPLWVCDDEYRYIYSTLTIYATFAYHLYCVSSTNYTHTYICVHANIHAHIFTFNLSYPCNHRFSMQILFLIHMQIIPELFGRDVSIASQRFMLYKCMQWSNLIKWCS